MERASPVDALPPQAKCLLGNVVSVAFQVVLISATCGLSSPESSAAERKAEPVLGLLAVSGVRVRISTVEERSAGLAAAGVWLSVCLFVFTFLGLRLLAVFPRLCTRTATAETLGTSSLPE